MITVVVVIITNAFVAVSWHPSSPGSRSAQQRNRSNLYSYISVRSNILALNGCPLHRTILGPAISANPTIVGRRMTEIVRAQ